MSGRTRLRVGISTCPNDTFAFHALLTGKQRCDGLALDFTLLDVEELNRRMLAGELDVAKVSAHAALAMAERILVLESGAALGFGVGPLVLCAGDRRRPSEPAPPLVLCPGQWTTAHLLWRLFHPEPARVEQVVFSEIMPALEAGRADLGVCIHEGRFTYAERGLERVEDLGERWERETGVALPLGLIVCRRELGRERAAALGRALRASLERSLARPEAALPTMRQHAQELAPAVLWKHVELYVNDRTRALGDEGRRSLATLERLARERGLLDAGARLEVVDPERPGAAGIAAEAPEPSPVRAAAHETGRLFHLASEQAWSHFHHSSATRWAPPSLEKEGFVHLSFAEQLAGTLQAHFGKARSLVLLEVDRSRLGSALRLEPSRGGELFPHLWRALARDELLGVWHLHHGGGAWTLPELAREARNDRPPAEAP